MRREGRKRGNIEGKAGQREEEQAGRRMEAPDVKNKVY